MYADFDISAIKLSHRQSVVKIFRIKGVDGERHDVPKVTTFRIHRFRRHQRATILLEIFRISDNAGREIA